MSNLGYRPLLKFDRMFTRNVTFSSPFFSGCSPCTRVFIFKLHMTSSIKTRCANIDVSCISVNFLLSNFLPFNIISGVVLKAANLCWLCGNLSRYKYRIFSPASKGLKETFQLNFWVVFFNSLSQPEFPKLTWWFSLACRWGSSSRVLAHHRR